MQAKLPILLWPQKKLARKEGRKSVSETDRQTLELLRRPQVYFLPEQQGQKRERRRTRLVGPQPTCLLHGAREWRTEDVEVTP